MKTVFKSIIVFGLIFAGSESLVQQASAQETQITPMHLPSVGPVPPAPNEAQVTYDPNANASLAYLVEISRFIGGGVEQLFASVQSAQTVLQAQLAAVSGPKEFPASNSPADVAARQGGLGLWEMAMSALNGAPDGPDELKVALNNFRDTYHLDNAYALRNDQNFSNVIVSNASAQGAVAASTAEESYKRANASMERLNGYIGALQNSSDVKTSVDINTRVMIEVAQQLNESLRTQAAIASVAGTYLMALGADAAAPDTFDLKNFNR